MKEVELAKLVIDWLKNQYWEVYQEVDCGRIADIVATSHNLSWIIECKTSLNLALLEQSFLWKHWSNFISIAVPTPKRYNIQGRRVAEWFLRYHGIGLIYVKQNPAIVRTNISPKIFRPKNPNIIKYLNEQQKTFAEAGNSNGKRWTPFQQTCNILKEIVRKNPGISLKQCIEMIDHHYASDKTAKVCLTKYILSGTVIDNVEGIQEGKNIKLYIKE